jgi:hypothetical protein
MLLLENGSFQGAWGGGSLRTPSDVRGTLFYDWSNTGYYVDPASSSYLYSLILSGNSYFRPQTWIQFDGTYGLYWPSSYGAHLSANDLSTYTQIALRGSKNSYSGIFDQYSGVTGIMYDSGGNGGIYREGSGRWYLYHNVGNNCLGIGSSATSSSYYLYVSGAIYSTGNIVAYSDVRKKKDIVTIDGALDKVNRMRGVYYTRIETDDPKIDPNKRQVGVIAQEMNEVLPEVVTYAADVDEYGVQYGNLVGVLIEAIKELKVEVETLKSKVH